MTKLLSGAEDRHRSPVHPGGLCSATPQGALCQAWTPLPTQGAQHRSLPSPGAALAPSRSLVKAEGGWWVWVWVWVWVNLQLSARHSQHEGQTDVYRHFTSRHLMVSIHFMKSPKLVISQNDWVRNSHRGTLHINVPGGAIRTCVSRHLQPASSTDQATLTASPTFLAKISTQGVRLGPQPPPACLAGTEHWVVAGPPVGTSTQELLLNHHSL